MNTQPDYVWHPTPVALDELNKVMRELGWPELVAFPPGFYDQYQSGPLRPVGAA